MELFLIISTKEVVFSSALFFFAFYSTIATVTLRCRVFIQIFTDFQWCSGAWRSGSYFLIK